MTVKKDVLAPVNTEQSTPGMKNALQEPRNWRGLGETSVSQAITDNPTKQPICPAVLKKT